MMPRVFIARGWFGRYHVYVHDARRPQWLATCKSIELAEAVKSYMEREITRAIAS